MKLWKKIVSFAVLTALVLSGINYNPKMALENNDSNNDQLVGESVNEPLGHYRLKNQTTGETFLAYCADRNLSYPKGETYAKQENAFEVNDQKAKDIIWNGYPFNASGFKEKFGLNNSEFQTVTQNALWYHWQKLQGNSHSIGGNLNAKIVDAYFDFIYEKNLNIIGIKPDSAKLKAEYNFQSAPQGLKLRVYKTGDANVQRLVRPEFDERPVLKVSKVNFKGQRLNGATLELKQVGDDKPIATWTTADDSDHEITLDVDAENPIKEYTITELAAPSGYVQLTEPIKIKVERETTGNNVISRWDAELGYYSAKESLSDNYILKIKNAKTRKNFNFIKHSTDGEVLEGVEIQFINNDSNEVETTMISQAQPSEVSLQMDTSYVIKEIKPKPGFKAFRPINIKVGRDGRITWTADRNRNIKLDQNGNYVLYNSDNKFTLSINKLNKRNHVVEGAKFDVLVWSENLASTNLFNADGDRILGSDLTNKSVVLDGENLNCGVFLSDFRIKDAPIKLTFDKGTMIDNNVTLRIFVIEKEPLNGYKTIDSNDPSKKLCLDMKYAKSPNGDTVIRTHMRQTIAHLQDDGSYLIHPDNESEADKQFATGHIKVFNNDPLQYTFINDKISESQKTITIQKFDAFGKRVAGVDFIIPHLGFATDEDDNEYEINEKWTTDNTDHTVRVYPDTYTLYEKNSPYGFRGIYPVTFRLKDDGNLEIVDDPSEAASVKGNVLKIINKRHYGSNDKAPVIISKNDINGGKISLNGIKLTFTDKNDQAETLTITNGSGNIGLVPGKYKVTETIEANSDADRSFEKINEFTIEVAEDGSLEILAKDAHDDISIFDGNGLRIVDNYKKRTVKLAKVNGNDYVKGAKIAIKTKDVVIDNQITKKGKVVYAFMSGEQDEVINLNPGNYIFHEESAPAGYMLVDDFDFRVSELGVIEVENKPDYVEIAGDKLSVTDATEYKTVKFSKQNLAGEEIPGAEITIKQNGQIIKSFTSQAGVTAEVALLPGEYTFHEENVSGNYVTVTDFNFSVDSSNRITLVAPISGNVTKVGDKIIIVDDYQNAKEFFFSKQDMGGNEIAGALIDIKQGGTTVAKWTSVEGKTKRLRLPSGDYTFTEEAPAGYETVQTTFNFNLSDSGQVTITGSNDPKLTVVNNTLVLKNQIDILHNPENANTKKVKISKVDLLGKEIAGALIEISRDEVLVERFKSQAGAVHEMNLEPGNYLLHEVAAPKGFLTVTDVDFTVNADGSVTVNHKKASYTDNVFKITNEAMNDELKEADDLTNDVDVVFSKKAVNGTEELVGANLKIYKGEVNKDGELIASQDTTGSANQNGSDQNQDSLAGKATIIAEWESTATPHTVKLKPGVYTMVETTAPDGYDKAESIVFQVTDDLKVKIKDGNQFIDAANATVQMLDSQKAVGVKSVKVVKKWQGGEPTEITVNLLQNGTKFKEAKLNSANKFTYTFNDLPLAASPFAGAEQYTYTVNEDGVQNGKVVINDREYEVTTTEVEDGFEIKNIYQPKNADISFLKFAKENDQEVPLSNAKLKVVKLNHNDDGSISREEKPEWTFISDAANPKLITLSEGEYELSEVEAPEGYALAEPIIFRINYQAVLEIASINSVTKAEEYKAEPGNTVKMEDKRAVSLLDPAYKDLKVVKKWKGRVEEDATIGIELYQEVDGQVTKLGDKTITLNSKDNWEGVFKGLPAEVRTDKVENGKHVVEYKRINYFVKETGENKGRVSFKSYFYGVGIQPIEEIVDDGNGSNHSFVKGFEITNTYEPTTKDIIFSKQAVNGTSELAGANLKVVKGVDPQGTEVIKTWTSGDTAVTIKLEEGEYTMIETSAPKGYVVAENITFRVTHEGTLEIMNKDGVYENQVDSTVQMRDKLALVDLEPIASKGIAVQKFWLDDYGNNKGSEIDSIKVELYKDGVKLDQTLELKRSENFKGEFKNQPIIDPKTLTPINYSVKEVGESHSSVYIAGIDYDVIYSGNAKEGFRIINSVHYDDEDSNNGGNGINGQGGNGINGQGGNGINGQGGNGINGQGGNGINGQGGNGINGQGGNGINGQGGNGINGQGGNGINGQGGNRIPKTGEASNVAGLILLILAMVMTLFVIARTYQRREI